MRTLQIVVIVFLHFSLLHGQDTFAYEFEAQLYSNSDGSEFFLGNWTETGETTNPTGGRIRVNSNQLRFVNLDTRYITRNLDLSGYVDVTLTLDYDRDRGDESMDVQLFNGSIFVTVATVSGTNSLSYDLDTSEISSSSAIRFVATDGDWDAGDDRYFIDNVLFTTQIPDQPPLVVGSGDQAYCPGGSRL